MLPLVGISIVGILIWALIAHFFMRERITFKESIFKVGGASLIITCVLGMIFFKSTYDTAILNGYVTGKEKVRVSCDHSYQCRCRYTGTGDNRRRVCSTCYRHSYDYDWRVYTTVGTREISRVNSQGTRMPPRWEKVIINEPAASTESYTNYVLASPNSLFKMDKLEDDAVRFGKLIPEYPEVYDYYRVNRVLSAGASYPAATKLNDYLNQGLRTLGKEKQVNIVVIATSSQNPEYRYALERAWVGGKKNDVIVIFGIDGNSYSWMDTITFAGNSGNEMMAIQMRDRIGELKEINQFGSPELLSATILATIKTDFHRKEMKDFEYLKGQYRPSTGAITAYSIFVVVLLTGLTIFFYNFDLERSDWHRVPYLKPTRRTHFN